MNKTEKSSSLLKSNILKRAQNLMDKELKWLSPVSSLQTMGGKDLGLSIESSLTDVLKGKVERVQLRNRDTAVLMSVAHYEEMLRMKEMCSALVERLQECEVETTADAYDALYLRITSDISKQSADRLFSASPADLRLSYQPGSSES